MKSFSSYKLLIEAVEFSEKHFRSKPHKSSLHDLFFLPLFRVGALEDVFHFTEIQIMLGLLLAAFISDSWYCGLQLTAYWGTIKNKKRKCVCGGELKRRAWSIK